MATPSISKFLMVSYIGSRRGYPSWWTQEDRDAADKVNTQILPAYYKAKVAADEHLAALAKKRGKGFQAIDLRPGTLSDDPATGKVWLGEFPLSCCMMIARDGIEMDCADGGVNRQDVESRQSPEGGRGKGGGRLAGAG